jgi:hypothetical protein
MPDISLDAAKRRFSELVLRYARHSSLISQPSAERLASIPWERIASFASFALYLSEKSQFANTIPLPDAKSIVLLTLRDGVTH